MINSKPFALIVALFLLLAFTANAQNTIGIGMGIHYSNWIIKVSDSTEAVIPDEDLKNVALPSFQISIPISFQIEEKVFFQTGINFVQQGIRSQEFEERNGFSAVCTEDVIVNYLQVPLLLKNQYQLGDGKKIDSEFLILVNFLSD